MIRELGIEVWKAIEAKDLESLMSLVAEDAVALYGKWKMVVDIDNSDLPAPELSTE